MIKKILAVLLSLSFLAQEAKAVKVGYAPPSSGATVTTSAVNCPSSTGLIRFDGSTFVVDCDNNRTGVGVTNPGHALSILGPANGAAQRISGATSGTLDFGIQAGGSGYAGGIWVNGALNATLIDGGMRLGSDVTNPPANTLITGAMGLGVSSPTYKGQIRGSGSNDQTLFLTERSDGSDVTETGTDSGGDGYWRLYNAAGAPRIHMSGSSTGRIGVGTTAPLRAFHIVGGDAVVNGVFDVVNASTTLAGPNGRGNGVCDGETLCVANAGNASMTIAAGTGNSSVLYFTDDTTLAGRVQYLHSTNAMGFGTNQNAANMFLFSNGAFHLQGASATIVGAGSDSSTYSLGVYKADGTAILRARNNGNVEADSIYVANTGAGIVYGNTTSGAQEVLNTSDGNDNGVMHTSGGGSPEVTRGAFTALYGNEHGSNPGDYRIFTGDVAGGDFLVHTGNNIRYMSITRTGLTSFGQDVTACSTCTVQIGGTLNVTGDLRQGTARSCSTGTTTDADGKFDGCVASDLSLKKEIKPLALTPNAIDLLKPSTWKWKDSKNRGTKINAGFIAQDVAKVFPQAVVPAGITDKGAPLKGIDSNAMIAALVLEIQALRKRVATLEAAP